MTRHTFSCRLRGPAAVLAAALLAAGCGRKAEAPSEPELDLSKAREIFAGPLSALRSPTNVLVTVDGKAITEGEVATEAQQFTARLRMGYPPERVAQMQDQIRQQALDSLILRQLLRKAIEEENVVVTDEDMQQTRERLQANLPPDVTVEQYLARLNVGDENLREALRIEKLLLEKAGPPAEPTDEEIASFYEENKERFELPESVSASHILIAFDPDDDEQAKQEKRARIEDIRRQILEGADFAEMARQHSDCPSKAQGGQLGTFGRGRMVPEFEQAAFTQAVDEIGPVVETRYGYHIIRVTQHQAPHLGSLEEMKPGITRMLANRAQQRRIEEYLAGLRQKADIQFAQKP